MARVYSLDKQAALDANSSNNFINKTGKYVGIIKTCFYDKNTNGTESVNIQFESNESQESPLLSIYTHNKNGEPLIGYNLFNALMTCCRVKKTTWETGTVELFNYDSKQLEKQPKEICIELKNKPIGLVLREEEYQNKQGEVKTRIVIFAPFEANTELMANEILTNVTTPVSLAKTMDWIAQNPIKKLKLTTPQPQYQSSQPQNRSQQAAPNFDDFDDDIPF